MRATLLHRFRSALARAGDVPFGRDRRGATTMIFALSILPVMVAVGATIDYTSAQRVRSDLDLTADAAVLAAVTRTALTTTPETARKAAEAFFSATAAKQGLTSYTVKATVADANGVRTASLQYSGSVPTTLMNMAGVSQFALAGSSQATSAAPIYMDFYLVLDNTPSMGVGATPIDVATLVNATSDKCGFACHDLSQNGNDYYALAQKLGVTMRIDVVRQATQKLMDTASSTALVPGQFRAAIYTLGTSCNTTGLTQISALSSDLAKTKTNAAAIDLMSVPYQGYNNDQCTDFDGSLATLNTTIPAPGDGSTPTSAQKVAFFVSDGVADAYYPTTCTKPTTGGRCQEPLTAAACTKLKDRGVKVAVLYTTYLPLPTNDWYKTWIAPFQTGISPQMQACASPGLFFEVSPTQGIADAMIALFQRAVVQTRLTH